MFAPAPSAKSFLARTYEMLQDSRNESAVAWGRDGTSITLVNLELFSSVVLPRYFSHNNLSSFVRQLNLYGFSKLADGAHGREFSHLQFTRENPEAATSIKRKHVGSRPGGTTTTIVKAQDCSECPQLAAINDRQDRFEDTLEGLRTENDQLRYENRHLWSAVMESDCRLREVVDNLQQVFAIVHRACSSTDAAPEGGGASGSSAGSTASSTAPAAAAPAAPATPAAAPPPPASLLTSREFGDAVAGLMRGLTSVLYNSSRHIPPGTMAQPPAPARVVTAERVAVADVNEDRHKRARVSMEPDVGRGSGVGVVGGGAAGERAVSDQIAVLSEWSGGDDRLTGLELFDGELFDSTAYGDDMYA